MKNYQAMALNMWVLCGSVGYTIGQSTGLAVGLSVSSLVNLALMFFIGSR